jgi:hypothetical protein
MRRPILRLARLGLLVVATLASVTPARSDVVLYSNITTFTGFGVTNGGAANVAGDNITTMLADDITPGPGLGGGTVDDVVFSVLNFNAAPVSARPRVRFYAADGAGGGPGTLLAGFTFNPITFAALTGALYEFNNGGAALFSIPNGTFWAGIVFDDNNGTTGATLAQLNNLGVLTFNPPTVGSSQDVFFATNAAGSFLGNNPAGGFFNFGGTPVANFGWQFSGTPGTTAVPEPSPLLLGATAGLLLLGATWARRARRG